MGKYCTDFVKEDILRGDELKLKERNTAGYWYMTSNFNIPLLPRAPSYGLMLPAEIPAVVNAMAPREATVCLVL
jgi:hypothetical protein